MTKFIIESEFSEFSSEEEPDGYNVYVNDVKAAEYGDYYHDKGSEKAEAFIEGYCFAKNIKNEYSVEYRVKYNAYEEEE